MLPMNIAGRHVCCKAKVVIVTHESLPGQSPSSTKIGEHNWRGGLSIVIQRLHSDAGISRTIIIIVTHGFPYSSRDSKVQAARPLKPAPRNIAEATSKNETPNGRSIDYTRDNYYYRHPAIFCAGCKTARELR